jgi:RHS repeat-associated protein
VSGENHYQLSGKEFENDYDLGWSDHGMRRYDPALARWTGVDPLAGVYADMSPYHYVVGNPVSFVDLNGASVGDGHGVLPPHAKDCFGFDEDKGGGSGSGGGGGGSGDNSKPPPPPPPPPPSDLNNPANGNTSLERNRSYSGGGCSIQPRTTIEGGGMAAGGGTVNGAGPEDPRVHYVVKHQTLSEISKIYGVSVEDLVTMNRISNPNCIYEGQELSVNPECNFTNNPRGGYRNPSNNKFVITQFTDVAEVMTTFALNEFENLLIDGGGAIESLKKWDVIKLFTSQAMSKFNEDGIIQGGESFSSNYSPGALFFTYLKRMFKREVCVVCPVHAIGSFGFSARVNADEESITYCIYDWKTVSSLTDGILGNRFNPRRNNNKNGIQPFTTQYIRFIWTSKLDR